MSYGLGAIGVLLEFLDPVGSLVSTLLVGWLLVGHTFSTYTLFILSVVVL